MYKLYDDTQDTLFTELQDIFRYFNFLIKYVDNSYLNDEGL